MENKPRIEQLFDQMLDEAPVMFTPKMKPYILEFAKIYAKEVAEKSLEKASINAKVTHEDMGEIQFYTVNKSSITHSKNIILDI